MIARLIFEVYFSDVHSEAGTIILGALEDTTVSTFVVSI